MDRVLQYLELLPPLFLPVALPLIVIGALIMAFVVPSRHHLGLVLAMAPPALLSNQFIELPTLQAISKVFCPAVFVLILCVTLSRKANRSVSLFSIGFVLIGLVGAVLISRCADAPLQIYLCLLYAFVAVVTICLVTRLGTPEDVQSALLGLFIGFVISTGILAAGFFLDPLSMDIATAYRFSPWGSNPNLFLCELVLAFAGALHLVLSRGAAPWRLFNVGVAALAFALLALTGSRSALLLLLMILPPFTWRLLTKPIIAVFAGIMLIAVAGWFGAKTEQGISTGRYTNTETDRWNIAALYLDEIKQRPVMGVFERPGLDSMAIESSKTHAHNTFILVLYRGGILFFALYMAVMLWTFYSCIRVVLARHRMGIDPQLVSLLACLAMASYAFGIVEYVNFWATNTLCFMQIFFSTLMMSWAADLANNRLPAHRSSVPLVRSHYVAIPTSHL